MDEIILHQYETSPFSEKIRRILGWKKLAWRAVEQPVIAPKPKLTPLTGGYRKIPVMQLGADVYCDTALIARMLEAIRPEPTIFAGGRGASEAIAHWADHWLFLGVVPPAVGKLLPLLPAEFMQDREKMSPGFTVANMQASLPDARSRVVAALDWLDSQLAGGRARFLLGDAFTLADAACFHNLWFLRNDPEAFSWVEAKPALRDWFARVEAIGCGDKRTMDPDEALAIAKNARPRTEPRDDGSDPNGVRPGMRIAVVADDYGPETVTGTAVVVTAQEIALRREDPEVGEVVVHFPRTGFRVTKT